MSTREPIFGALFDLASSLSWGSPSQTFAFTSRRVKLFDDLAGQFPALCQAEHDEMHSQEIGMPPIRKLTASWIIYTQAGKDPNTVPATDINNIIDAVEAILPDGSDGEWQALGGLVYSCMIEGKVFKDPGDLDGTGLLIIPITITIP